MRRFGAAARFWILLVASAWLTPSVVAVAVPLQAATHQVAPPVTVELQPDTGSVGLSPYVSFHHDPDGELRVAGARRLAASGGFEPLPQGNPAFGFQPGAFWFHVRVVNHDPGEQKRFLVQDYPLSDRLDLYVVGADGQVRHAAGGDNLPFARRAVEYHMPSFELLLPAGEPVDLLLRVRSQSSMQVPLVLHTPASLAEAMHDAQWGIGLYYGILLALFVYNLVLWLMLRDASYLWYLLHIIAFGLVLFTLNGLGFQYLWPDSPWFADRAVPLSICLAQVGMQQFARHFLELHERWRFGDRVGLAMIGFFVLLAIASLQLPYRISTPLASAAVFVSIAWIAIESIVVMSRGYKPARLFLLAWSMFLLGTAMIAAVAFGLLPKTFVTIYGVQIGSALEMLLLSVALGYRYAALRNENERIVHRAKAELERQVEERTTELRNALAQLGDAHARLRESSRRDGLTGLHTRAHFREGFGQLIARARANGRPLSLLMIDLDHFKQINDCHGHLVGDDCLRWAAHVVGQALRPHEALLARFGGEEFVVGLPDLGRTAATAVAAELVRQLRASPCESGGRSIAVTASIGVHELDLLGGEDTDAALQCADEALYQAKADGRDCVRWLPEDAVPPPRTLALG
ncbi:sensor domain-containing diguanylate cyclase [Novilysobacter spongiicola]|uniref:diguanylate cyclase n=1 Tax=Lysobacter spongiicola DSM 21749 TaxID=1122188 RepID=A0A1T4R441_9GAMM|nr:diguanylate cyclase [Lysobacter spongiicola]SKA10832.1 diguanylate cyclase (GGDEF) domain-containing protein [Lysobacter spongiicola DSM 21749]